MEQKSVELMMVITKSEGKMRENLIGGVKWRIEEAQKRGDVTSSEGKSYVKTEIVTNIVQFMRKVDDNIQAIESKSFNTLFANMPIDLKTGEMEPSDALYQFDFPSGQLMPANIAKMRHEIALEAFQKIMAYVKARGFEGLGIGSQPPQHKGVSITVLRQLLTRYYLLSKQNIFQKLKNIKSQKNEKRRNSIS